MGRSACCEKLGLKKGPWTPEEDQKLLAYIEEHGHGCWRALPTKAGLQRCGKSCRLRWSNYLRPDIKRGQFSVQEEHTLIQLHALLGNRWSAIASHLPKRTDNEIKNFWNTHLKKRLAKMGIDPVTHKPKCDALASADSHASKTAANLSHMAQWESARLEAEARLVRESNLLRFASSSDVASASSTTNIPSPLPPLGSAASALRALHNSSPPSPATVMPPSLAVFRAWQGVWAKSGRISRYGQSGRDGKIDLESPTSTLCFSESVQPVGAIGPVNHHNPPSVLRQCGDRRDGSGDVQGRGQEMEGEEVDWKCFPTPMQLFDTKGTSESLVSATFPVDSSPVFGGDHHVSSWLHESLKTGPASAAASTIGHFSEGFTDMLLNHSEEHNSFEDAGGLAGSRKGNRENQEENNYWSSILNLVNSSSPSNSPDCVLV